MADPTLVLWGYFLYLQWTASPETVEMPPITVVYAKDEEDDCDEARDWFKANRPHMSVSECVPQYAPKMQNEGTKVKIAKRASRKVTHHHTVKHRRARAAATPSSSFAQAAGGAS